MAEFTSNPIHDRLTVEERRRLRAFKRFKLHHLDDSDRINKLAAVVDDIERRLVRRIAELERRVYELAPGPEREAGSLSPRRKERE